MADIIHEFFVKSSPERIFAMFATPKGLNEWWTKEASGEPRVGADLNLYFGPQYTWKAKVTRCVPGREFELEMTQAHDDWQGTRVGCKLSADKPGVTRVYFYHVDWPEANEHWRVSNYCWAMYLRVLRRLLEYGETVAYEKRLDA